jgi:hypothetical protein
MNFNKLYLKTIKYFPSEIDISDGKFIEATNGFRFDHLSHAWDLAESYSENEWEILLSWVIFRVLHRKAKSLYESEKSRFVIVDTTIDIFDLQKMYLEALQEGGYEDMLKEYTEANKDS